ncbi:sugar ABC transporter permease [Kribbella sp. NPDC000426]|uniref:carbohydrate ABC transporter permease n=1 Tax=Kribbella sp. NPDC000426 TaxID=3154255 RepID=UPI003333B08D
MTDEVAIRRTAVTRAARKLRSGVSGQSRLERRWGLLLAMPAIIGFVVFSLAPMAVSAVLSLTDWTIGSTPSFVGVDNYVHMFSRDPLFLKSLGVTTYYTLGAVPLTLVVAFAIAMLLNAKVRGLGVYRTIYYLPTLVPSVANAVLWLWIFNPDFGLLNSTLRQLGAPTSNWVFSETAVVPSLILMSSWGFGNIMVIFLAGLQGVPRHLYEAVSIDGGGAWRQFRHVTLPMMTPVLFYNLVTSIIGTFQVFNQAYIMTQGGPNNASTFYVYYLYTTAFTKSQMGYASALAWALFVIVMVITVALFRSSNRWVYYEMGAAR